jgi:ATP-dependent DNA helicase PIF1
MNQKQQEAFLLCQAGENIFLTGPAGTGKSFTLQRIIKWADTMDKDIGVTASTGLAAYLLRGRTVHSFLGIGLGSKPAETLAANILKKNQPLYKRLSNLDILIIDEISMIDDEFLDKISDVLSIIRKNKTPFGGIQMILSGDFCQLPPIKGKYCFLSKVWQVANIKTVVLEELVRQDGDTEFQKILSEVRWGSCSKDILKILKKKQTTEFKNAIKPTKLYSTNINVDAINSKEYEKLLNDGATARRYDTKYSLHVASKVWSESVKIPEYIDLCVGAQVMVTWNLPCDPTIINGTRGVIVSLDDTGPRLKLVTGREVKIEYLKMTSEDDDKIAVHFIPLRLAYAITVHKSQGSTLDAIEIDLGDSIFEYGQAYTALSRARSLDSIRVVAVKSKSFRTHPLVKEFYGVSQK